MSNAEQQFRLAEIEVNKSPLDERIIGIFRYESEGRQKKGPIFLLLVEISSTAYVYEQLLDVLNATAEQARRLTVGFDTDPMARFEKVIQRLNEAISAFVEQSPTPITWNRVSVYAIELSDAHLCFSGVGRLTNLFLQKQENGTYRSFDLFGSLEQPTEVNPKKVFSSLVCGDIKPGDLLLAGTQNLERLRNELRLIDRLSTLPPVTATLEIRQDLERRDIPDDFAGIIIASVELPRPSVETPAIAVPTKEKSTESVEKMHRDEQEAEAMLAPAVPLPQKNVFDLAHWKQVGADAFAKTKTFIQEHLKPQPKLKDPVTLASLRGMNAGHGSFMTKKRRLTLMAGGVVFLAAIIGTLWYRHARTVAAEQATWNASYDQAVDRKNRAEADLVYNNEDHARSLIQEANGILNNLDEKNTYRKKAKADLRQELSDVSVKLKHEVHVDHPTELFALPNGSGNQSLQAPVLYKNNLYVVDQNGQAVVQINPGTRETKRIGLSSDQTQVLASMADQNGLYFFVATHTLLAVDPVAGKVKTIPFGLNKATTIRALVLYNKRLYALDTGKNMIWKYSPADGGFGNESSYLKQTDTDLSQGTALTIDSSVYVGQSNGKLVRYLSGVQENWVPNQTDPPLTHIDSLWTSPDTDRLVVADSVGKRILVFRKDGALISQILSPELKGPTAVTADTTAKKIYTVDGNRVLSFDLP